LTAASTVSEATTTMPAATPSTTSVGATASDADSDIDVIAGAAGGAAGALLLVAVVVFLACRSRRASRAPPLQATPAASPQATAASPIYGTPLRNVQEQYEVGPVYNTVLTASSYGTAPAAPYGELTLT